MTEKITEELHKRELKCECGEWILVPCPGEMIECNCGNRFECQAKPAEPIYNPALADAELARVQEAIDDAEGQGRR